MGKVVGSVIDRTRKYEIIVYAALWLLLILMPFFNEIMRVVNGRDFSWYDICRWWLGLVPYILIFCINTFILFPKLLLKNRFKEYMAISLVLIAGFVAFQLLTFDTRMVAAHRVIKSAVCPAFAPAIQIPGTADAYPYGYSLPFVSYSCQCRCSCRLQIYT